MAPKGNRVDLPGGGAMRRNAPGIPVEVSDKGSWQFDEQKILADAAAAFGMKLTWLHLVRLATAVGLSRVRDG